MTKLLFIVFRNIFEGTNILNMRFFKWIRNTMYNRIKKEYIYVEGFKIKIDSRDSLRLSLNPNYEELVVKTMKEIVKEWDNVIDIGANIGYYTLILSKIVGEKGRVFAFEPDLLNNYDILSYNIIENSLKNINAFPYAITNENKVGKLFLSKDNYGDHRLVDDGNRECVDVRCYKLDTIFIDKSINYSLIKIDVQGCETRVLQGAEDFFDRQKNIRIITECWNYGLKRADSSAEEYLTELSSMGFKFTLLDKQVKSISIKEILSSDYVKGKNYCNLLCER